MIQSQTLLLSTIPQATQMHKLTHIHLELVPCNTLGHYLADYTLNQLEAIQDRHSGIKLTLAWMLGHTGIEGNECVDEEAKKVAHGESSPQRQLPKMCGKELLFSRSATHQHNAKTIKTKAKKWLKGSPRCQKLQRIDPSMPSSKFRKDTASLVRWQASLLIQLRTGHIPLQKQLHRVGKAVPDMPRVRHRRRDGPPLPADLPHVSGTQKQDRVPSWKTGQVCRHLAFDTLLSNPKAFSHLFRYIHYTRRFRNPTG